MSRLKARYMRLFNATHSFVSASDLKRIAEYYRLRLSLVEAPPDLAENVQELRRLHEERNKKDSDELAKQFKNVAHKSPAIWLTVFYEDAKEVHGNFPNGVWLMNESAHRFLQDSKIAKEYLKNHVGR